MEDNPQQAFHTAAIIKAAGREDACSICGDEPAHDYVLANEAHAKDMIATLRLCRDCHFIRHKSGERFEPLNEFKPRFQ